MKPTPKQMSEYLWKGVRHETPQKSTINGDNETHPTKGHQKVASFPLPRQKQGNKSPS